ncbi:serine/threonine protein kinase [bacterium]|nr:serine/threonine protein kinase [bacterium]
MAEDAGLRATGGFAVGTGAIGELLAEHALERAASALAPGTVVDARYEVRELLGQGGFGAVYRAFHRELGEELALKVLKPEVARSEEGRARFLREARVLKAFVHPLAVQLRDFGRDEERGLYLAMDLVPGPTLASVLSRDKVLAEPRALALARQLLLVLEAAHASSLVHRDLKPQNLVLTKNARGEEELRVLDFGLAKAIKESRDGGLTARGVACGTLAYMSPEQAAGGRVDGRADIYAAGAILYEALSGKRPFPIEASDAEDEVLALLYKLATEEPAPLESIAPSVSPGVARAVMRALARKPEARFASASAFLAALAAPYERRPRSSWKRRLLSLVALVAAGATAVVLRGRFSGAVLAPDASAPGRSSAPRQIAGAVNPAEVVPIGAAGQLAGTRHFVALGGSLYAIDERGDLREIDAAASARRVGLAGGFADTIAAAAVGDRLATLGRGSLWLTDVRTGARERAGEPETWAEGVALACLDGRLHVLARDGTLYETDGRTRKKACQPYSEWPGVRALTTVKGSFWALDAAGTPQKTLLLPRESATAVPLEWVFARGSGAWASTRLFASHEGWLLRLEEDGTLLRTTAIGWLDYQVGRAGEWPGALGMTSLDGRLYIVGASGTLYRVTIS